MNNKLKLLLQLSDDYTGLPPATLQALLMPEIAAHPDAGSSSVQLQLNADANGLSLQDASSP